jgi:hypothetical protein
VGNCRGEVPWKYVDPPEQKAYAVFMVSQYGDHGRPDLTIQIDNDLDLVSTATAVHVTTPSEADLLSGGGIATTCRLSTLVLSWADNPTI